jgi:hypothetical protein
MGEGGPGCGDQDRASPNFMGLAGFGLDIDIFCDFLYSVLLLNAILVLDVLGLDISRPQAGAPRIADSQARREPAARQRVPAWAGNRRLV